MQKQPQSAASKASWPRAISCERHQGPLGGLNYRHENEVPRLSSFHLSGNRTLIPIVDGKSDYQLFYGGKPLSGKRESWRLIVQDNT